MRAGRLKHRVTLQSIVLDKDARGAVTKTPTTVATVWAGVEPLSGRAWFDAQRENSSVSVRIVMRYRADIDETWRIVHKGVTYEIGSIIDVDMRHSDLHLMCRVVK